MIILVLAESGMYSTCSCGQSLKLEDSIMHDAVYKVDSLIIICLREQYYYSRNACITCTA